MKKYEVTYHLTNGEIKKVIYKNIKVSHFSQSINDIM